MFNGRRLHFQALIIVLMVIAVVVFEVGKWLLAILPSGL